MSVIVEFRLQSPDLPLMDALAAVPGMELHVEHEFAEDPYEPVIFLWAGGDDFETFEAHLSADDSVRSAEAIDEFDARRLYCIQISEQADVVMYPAGLEVDASQLSVTATHRGLDVRQRFVDRDAFARYRALCRERAVDLSVHRLYSTDDPQFVDEYDLSEKQRRLLQRALSEEYFEVPRGVTLRELADSFDISRQAASERLRRGLRHLVWNTLGPEESDAA